MVYGCAVLLFSIAGLLPAQFDPFGEPLPHGVLVRLGTIRFRHDYPVQRVHFSPDGKTLLGETTHEPGGKLWKAATGKPLAQFQGGPGLAYYPVFSPDGKLLADVSADGRARLWDFATGKVLRSWGKEPQSKKAMRDFVASQAHFSRDCKTLVIWGTCAKQEVLRRFDLATGKELRTQETHGAGVANLISPDGKTLVGLSEEITAFFLWDLDTGKKLHAFPHTAEDHDMGMALSPDGKTLIGLASDQRSVLIWDVATGKLIRQLHDKLGFYFFRKDLFSADSKWLALLNRNEHSIFIYELATGKRQTTLHTNEQFGYKAFSADGKLLAAATYFTVGVWEVATGKFVCQFAYDPGDNQTGGDLAFSPDGKTLAISKDHLIELGDVTTGKELRPVTGHLEGLSSLAFSPDGHTLATSGTDKIICRWDATTGKELQRSSKLPKPAPVQDIFGRPLVGYSRAGQALAAMSFLHNLYLLDIRAGKVLHHFDTLQGERFHYAFSADASQFAAVAENGDLHLWDVASGKERRPFSWYPPADQQVNPPPFDIPVLAFSPDGRTLAALGRPRALEFGKPPPPGIDPYQYEIRLWEMATGKERGRFAFNERTVEGFKEWVWLTSGGDYPEPFTLVFTADSKTLAIGNRHTLVLCELGAGKEVRRFSRPGLVANAAVFSPDGKLLAAPDRHGRIYLWEVATATLLGQFKVQAAQATVLAFSPDSKRLATGCTDTTVLIWDVAFFLNKGVLHSKELAVWWSRLADADAAQAFQAITALTADPRAAVVFLKERLSTPGKFEAKRMEQLLAKLGDKRFTVRQQAVQELERLAEAAEPALKKALPGANELETRCRIEQLLTRLDREPSPEMLRTLRVIEVLEQIGSPAARQVLQTLAQGMPGYRATEAAADALQRLATRAPVVH